MANTDKEFRNVSYMEEDAKEGILFEAWTQQWGMKVYPWYSMDRLKFSFIDKGAKGKGKSFDVCVNTMKSYAFDFETMKHEVLHDIRTPFDFVTILAAEKASGEKYPKRYHFVTGSNGEKSVGFCNSTKSDGYTVNASAIVNGKKEFCNIPVSYYDIYNIVQAYAETYEPRKKELAEMRKNGIAAREKEYITKGQPSYEKDPEMIGSEGAENVNHADSETNGTQGNTENIQNVPEANVAQQPPKGMHVTTASAISRDRASDYCLKARKDDATEINIRIPADVAEAMNAKNGIFDKFMAKVNQGSASFSFTGIKRKLNDGAEYVFASFC